jgi:hypothetical protein
MYPVSLSAWLACETTEGYTKEEFDDFTVLRLASSYNIPQILPGVYFECCRHDAAVILHSELTLEEKMTCFNATKTLRDMMGMHPNPYGFLYTTSVDCYQVDNGCRDCTYNALWTAVIYDCNALSTVAGRVADNTCNTMWPCCIFVNMQQNSNCPEAGLNHRPQRCAKQSKCITITPA